MDASLLSINERFPASYVGVDSDGLSSPEDNNRGYFGWEDERELNGDIALIPESSSFFESLSDMPDITNSLPSLDYQKMPDWSNIIFVDTLPHEDIVIMDPVPDQCQKSQSTYDLSNTFDGNSFDITEYINEPSQFQTRKVKSKGKKIDLQAQRYIIDEEADKLDTSDEIDVETVSEGTSFPVLEAQNPLDLLEQFEASEQPNLHHSKSNESFSKTYGFSDSMVSLEMQVNLIPTSPVDMFEKIPETPVDIFEDEENLVSVKIEQIDPNEDADVDIFEDVAKVEKNLISVKSERFDSSENSVLVVKDTKKYIKKEAKSPKKETKSTVEVSQIKREPKLPKLTETKIKKEKVSPKLEEVAKSLKPQEIQIKQEPNSLKPQTSEPPCVRNKQIIEALPQELIKRINESGKRKTITVIPPIPNTKKRFASRPIDCISQHRNKIQKTSASKLVHLDHDYCSSTTPYPKEPHKDSGFQSAEEEDRSVLRNQPTVKTADGKVMVSLLKVNTIRNNDNNEKKKLNLEEYRKRKCINSNAASQSSSPISSTCSSPLPEDENIRRRKHEEKLLQMAASVLNTPPKSAQISINGFPTPKVAAQIPVKNIVAPKPPPGVEKKTYVSAGINTILSSTNCIKSMMESDQQLKAIKPLLKKASNKISSNSLLASVIENIPKVKRKDPTYVELDNIEVIREDVVHYFFDKDRKKNATRSVATETDFDKKEDEIVEVLEGGSSPGSSCSGDSHSSRSRSSASSRHSYGGHSYKSPSIASPFSRSSRSRSRSRSPTRSISPKRSRKSSHERKNEVDERRVIYVGGLERGTTTDDLRRRFSRFGPVTNVKVHFRDHGVNYGFVTFLHQDDAFKAFDYGNDKTYPKYDICFGGRRTFCRNEYSDLDNMHEDYTYYTRRNSEVVDYASLLLEHEKARHS